MKKYVKFIIIFVLLIICCLLIYFFTTKNSDNSYTALKTYVSNIFGKSNLIPEFDDINKADPYWLWGNINQYLWSIPENEERNSKFADYTYKEITSVAKFLYGDDLTLSVPQSNDYMLYNKEQNTFGPPAYDSEEYFDYKIEKIEEKNNTYNVTIISYYIYPDFLGDKPSNEFEIFNISDYKLNSNNATPIVTFKEINEDYTKKILDNKDSFTKMLLTINFDTTSNLYHISSCKYLNTNSKDILSKYYKEMQNTFELYNIKYDYDEIYNSPEVLVENFDDLASIYTETALETYKKEMDLFIFKDNQVYIQAGDINVAEYIKNIEFSNIKETDSSISCTVNRTFRKSFNPDDKEYNETYKISNDFVIIKDDNSWKIDKFSYNNITE